MRLTTVQHSQPRPPHSRVQLPTVATSVLLAAGMASVFVVDRLTDAPGVQHLYYFPIVFVAVKYGARAGAAAAAFAILLYHLANPHLLTRRYAELDILQIAVFVAAGWAAAKLADDARRLRRLAMTDDLTGLHNLRSFELELSRIVGTAHDEGTPVSVLVLDVDRLKALNDEHGHLAGAEAVRLVGHIIAAHIPGDAVACRYGGDEFVIAIPRCALPRARQVADTLRQRVQASVPALVGVQFPKGTLSISVGLAERSFKATAAALGSDAEISEALFRSADSALYAAKNSGRNRVCSA